MLKLIHLQYMYLTRNSIIIMYFTVKAHIIIRSSNTAISSNKSQNCYEYITKISIKIL